MGSKTSLSGTALVTGAASGIGKETALAFAEAGVRSVLLADINIEGALAAAEECRTCSSTAGFTAKAIRCDVTSEVDASNMVETAVKDYGRLDYYVHSAGMGNLAGARTPEINTEAFSRTMDTNVHGLMFCLRSVSSAMAKQDPRSYESRRYGKRSLGRGSIVVIGSGSSYVAMPGMMAYTASKHAVNGIAKTAALDLIPSEIRVNSLCPGFVDTPMMQASMKRHPNWEALMETLSPLKRAATPEEIADYVLFLCSPSASYINGTGLIIDAGATLTAAKM